MITVTKLGDLPFKDFAPRAQPVNPVQPRKAKRILPPVNFFRGLEHRDFAPNVQPIRRYFDPDSPLDPDWRLRAVCKGRGNSPREIAQWFPGPGGSQSGKVFCAVCPVKRECANFADEHNIEWGIWGGEIRHRHRKGIAA